MALPLFAVTLFVSAFLLFLVQPMIGKMILPKLGGTPQVWNTCMVFFQAALLAGYAYTHTVSTRLKLRYQLLIHGLILFVPLIILLPGGPFNITSWVPPPGANPIPSTLWLLTAVVGIPFFVVATSAPLLQRWFAYTGHPAAKDPYFLYGASNLGSMLALLAYPVIVEPLFHLRSIEFDLTSQNWFWTVGYFVLGALVVSCAALVWTTPAHVHEEADKASEKEHEALQAAAQTAIKAGPVPVKEPVTSIKQATGPRGTGFQKGKSGKKGKGPGHKQAITTKPASITARVTPITITKGPFVMDWWRRLRWIGLAAVPSSLMLGVTTYMSTDISAIPLLWIVPLTLYLLTFILVFMRSPILWIGDPHRVILFLQPFAILVLGFLLLTHQVSPLQFVIPCLILFPFFVIALACHGELAADRPPTKYLTEFYLLMSVGGVVGGIFNGIVAPVLFPGVWEFPIAIAIACLMRPVLVQGGALDDAVLMLFPEWKKKLEDSDRNADAQAAQRERERFHKMVDVFAGLLIGLMVLVLFVLWSGFGVQRLAEQFWRGTGANHPQVLENYVQKSYWAFVFGIPLVFCYTLKNRPLRFALGVGALLLVSMYHERSSDPSVTLLRAQRSYFGVLRVYQKTEFDEKREPARQNTYLMHGTTHHGLNYQFPDYLRRLATTYYHRKGPAGVIQEKFCWFKEPMNRYDSDARIQAAMAGLGANPLNLSAIPIEQIVCAWSELPYATVGLGTGTMASYCRPLQHMAYYEIDEKIRRFSLPEDGTEPVFNYVHDAMQRGGIVEIIMGDARQSMTEERTRPPEELNYPGGNTFANSQHRQNYYAAIYVDAFSSDAIPVHLITEEAIKMYFEKIREDGVLCLHTSNRHVNLVKPITDVAHKLKFAYRLGNDLGRDQKELGHFSSEWVMLARRSEYLPSGAMGDLHWEVPPPPGNRVWTDDYSNLVGVLRW